MLRIVIIAYAVVGVSMVSAQNRMTPNPDSDFTVNRAGSTITRYIGTDERVVVPSVINGNRITHIGNGAFQNNKVITQVVLPSSIISIGNSAFYNSTLRSITIQGALNSIGNNAFRGTNLQAFITWPNGLQKIPNGLYQSSDLSGSLVIPEGITEIGSLAFSETQIQSVTLPRTIQKIGHWAFSNCKLLRTVTIPSSVTSIIFENETFLDTNLNDASKKALTDRGHNGRF